MDRKPEPRWAPLALDDNETSSFELSTSTTLTIFRNNTAVQTKPPDDQPTQGNLQHNPPTGMDEPYPGWNRCSALELTSRAASAWDIGWWTSALHNRADANRRQNRRDDEPR